MFEKTGNDGIVDEFTFGQYQDRAVATAALQAHWSTWYTEQDFADIAAAGLNHVRYVISFYWIEGTRTPANPVTFDHLLLPFVSS
jgi:aryl-phospho-beta-D-glucosidase BglC (GH1 family)